VLLMVTAAHVGTVGHARMWKSPTSAQAVGVVCAPIRVHLGVKWSGKLVWARDQPHDCFLSGL
jgi:hypothetical protein